MCTVKTLHKWLVSARFTSLRLATRLKIMCENIAQRTERISVVVSDPQRSRKRSHIHGNQLQIVHKCARRTSRHAWIFIFPWFKRSRTNRDSATETIALKSKAARILYDLLCMLFMSCCGCWPERNAHDIRQTHRTAERTFVAVFTFWISIEYNDNIVLRALSFFLLAIFYLMFSFVWWSFSWTNHLNIKLIVIGDCSLFIFLTFETSGRIFCFLLFFFFKARVRYFHFVSFVYQTVKNSTGFRCIPKRKMGNRLWMNLCSHKTIVKDFWRHSRPFFVRFRENSILRKVKRI